jgi:uncharacterized membrane protein YfcA
LDTGGLSLAQTAVALVGATIGALIQGSIGFGFALLVVPILGLLRPEALPVTVLLLAIPMTAWMAIRERGAIDIAGFVQVTVGRVVGTVGGVWLLVIVPVGYLSVLVGAVVVIAALLSAFASRFEAGRKTRVAAGVVSGVMGTAAAVGGPPLALAYQRRPGSQLRSTLAASFVVGSIISLAGLGLAGKVEWWHAGLAVVLLPGLAAGLALSRHTARLLDRTWLRPSVLVFAGVAGLAAVIKGLTG